MNSTAPFAARFAARLIRLFTAASRNANRQPASAWHGARAKSRFWRHAWVGAALLLALLQWSGSPAHAAALSLADEKSVRGVIQSQLAAFAKDDAAKAFSYAAPNVRQATGSADQFMAMVRRGYPVVYRPASVAFLKPEVQGKDVVVRVQMLDAKGDAWLAVYTLQRQKNKAWRITGCQVTENKGRMA